jgi:predicted outer membrane protein
MSISRRTILAAGAIAAVPAVCSIPAALAQVGDASTAKAGADANIATWMGIDGFKQIEVSKPAEQKATDDAVKAFARAEIDEHETLKKKLMEKGLKPLVPPGKAGGAMPSPSEATAVLAMKNEVAVQCVENTNAELGKKSGAMYDHAYTVNQLEAHMQLKDTVQVALRHASPELKPVLSEAMGIIEQHLATLKDLHQKQLDALKKA